MDFSSFTNSLFGLVIALVVVLAFVMLASRYGLNHILAFTAQTWLVALVSLMLGIQLKNPSFYLLALICVVLRGVILPWVFYRILRLQMAYREGGGGIQPASSMLIGLGFVVFAVIIAVRLSKLMQIDSELTTLALATTFALVLMSFFMLIMRHHALSKIIALLMIENGIVLGGQLLVLDSNIFMALVAVFDVLLAVISFQLLTRYMLEQIRDTDNRKLKRLIG